MSKLNDFLFKFVKAATLSLASQEPSINDKDGNPPVMSASFYAFYGGNIAKLTKNSAWQHRRVEAIVISKSLDDKTIAGLINGINNKNAHNREARDERGKAISALLLRAMCQRVLEPNELEKEAESAIKDAMRALLRLEVNDFQPEPPNFDALSFLQECIHIQPNSEGFNKKWGQFCSHFLGDDLEALKTTRQEIANLMLVELTQQRSASKDTAGQTL